MPEEWKPNASPTLESEFCEYGAPTDAEGGMPEGWPLVTGDSEDSNKVSRELDFLDFVGKLKEVKRAGWVRSGVDGAESVADHTYRMTCMCFVLNPADGVDQTKCMKMAL